MSKITFRADDDLVRRIEALDASKSEVMRDALREYLDADGARNAHAPSDADGTLDALVAERVDALLAERLPRAMGTAPERDVNVSVTVEGGASHTVSDDVREPTPARPEPASDAERACAQCGENVDEGHVYCPNCGEKASRRLFCDCGDEIRTDWAFCPSCGRRTPSADVLDRS